MNYLKLVIAEKPSVAQSIAKVLGAGKRCDGYSEGNGYLVSWRVLPSPGGILALRAGYPSNEVRGHFHRWRTV